MNKALVRTIRILGVTAVYSLLFAASVFLTMSLLIKGDELATPDLIGKTIKSAYATAAQQGIYLKKTVGDFGSGYQPGTVVNQIPAPGTRVKEKSLVQIFVPSDLALVVVPNLIDQSLRDGENVLKKSKLKKGHVSYIGVKDVLLDQVVAQSVSAGSRVSENSLIDILVSRGAESASYMMPDLIGKEASKVLVFFESKGLKLSKIEAVSYFGLKPGIVLKQFPSPGFEISPKNQIGIQVSK
jgi:beta-lactam-binding protein with PASTA domain